jgi:hypothetical protein
MRTVTVSIGLLARQHGLTDDQMRRLIRQQITPALLEVVDPRRQDAGAVALQSVRVRLRKTP